MKALQYVEPGRAELRDLPRGEPGPGEVLVKVLAVTTCPHWDLHLMAGEPMFPGHELRYPYTPGQPGHEAMGEVAAVGEGVEAPRTRQRVVAWRDRGHDKPGCYAQYVLVQPDDLLAIPDNLVPEQVASLELGMCVQVSIDQLARLGLPAGGRVAVAGLGPAGLVAVQLARAAGAAEVIGIDPLAARRKLAERLGADRALSPDSPDLPAGRQAAGAFDAAIDCTGLAPAVQALMGRTRHAVALFGVLRREVSYGFEQWGGLTLVGYGRHNRAAAERTLEHVVEGRLNLAALISARLPLSRYADGIAMLRDKSAVKICFLPWES
jgi:threonine dehydrogenase-like Zn-dependent dehydrogenase